MADLAKKFVDRVAFAQGSGVNLADVQAELDSLVTQMGTAISQSTFNGDDLVSGAPQRNCKLWFLVSHEQVATFAQRQRFPSNPLNLSAIQTAFDAIDIVTAGGNEPGGASSDIGNSRSAALECD